MTKYGTDIYKNMYICKNRSQDIQKWPPAEGRHDVKRFLSCDHQDYTKNTGTKFHKKILNSHEVLDKDSQK